MNEKIFYRDPDGRVLIQRGMDSERKDVFSDKTVSFKIITFTADQKIPKS